MIIVPDGFDDSFGLFLFAHVEEALVEGIQCDDVFGLLRMAEVNHDKPYELRE